MFATLSLDTGVKIGVSLLCLALIGGAMICVEKTLDRHDEGFEYLKTGLAIIFVGSIVFGAGAILDNQHGTFFAVTAAVAIASVLLTSGLNVKNIGAGDGLAITILQVCLLAAIIVLLIAYFAVQHFTGLKLPGLGSGGGSQGVNKRQIGDVVEQGDGMFIVFDENNSRIGSVTLGGSRLKGFTSSQFHLVKDRTVYTYDSSLRPRGTRTM